MSESETRLKDAEPEPKPAKEFVSDLERLRPAKELDFDATPGFGEYAGFFPKEAVAHPAKMNTKLLAYLIQNYTKEGETVLDPMGGSGSTGVIAALHNRNAVVVELEDKFVAWEEQAKKRVDSAPAMTPKGSLRVVKGDARNLSQLLGLPIWEKANMTEDEFKRFSEEAVKKLMGGKKLDVVISSPPYADSKKGNADVDRLAEGWEAHQKTKWNSWGKSAHTEGRKRAYESLGSGYSESDENIGNLPMDAAILSPPYADSLEAGGGHALRTRDTVQGGRGYGAEVEANIGTLSAGRIDEVITSPPYSDSAMRDYGTSNEALLVWEAGIRRQLTEHGFIEYKGRHYTEQEWRAINKGELKPRGIPELWAEIISQRNETRYNEANPENIGNLEHGKVDAIVSSPPYSDSEAFKDSDFMKRISPDIEARTLKYKTGAHKSAHHSASVEAERAYMERTENGRVEHPNSIGKLRSEDGEIDSIISSPPYEDSVSDDKEGPGAGANEAKYGRWRKGSAKRNSYTQHDESVSSVITSPPYETTISRKNGRQTPTKESLRNMREYSENGQNIGNTSKETYLSAMMKVYSEMWKVLRPGGRAVIVIKPFTRNKKVVDLPWQTWLLLEHIGFKLEDTLKLRLHTMSFWRILQYRKHPDQEQIKHEYVIVVSKKSEVKV